MIDIETGTGSRVTFDGRSVTIERLRGISKSVFGERSTVVPVGQIAAVELVQPSWMRAGHIRFAVPGSQAAAARTAANRDEHAVLFSKSQAKEFEVLAAAVRAVISR